MGDCARSAFTATAPDDHTAMRRRGAALAARAAGVEILVGLARVDGPADLIRGDRVRRAVAGEVDVAGWLGGGRLRPGAGVLQRDLGVVDVADDRQAGDR